jgi:hypothetical protein
VVTTRDAGITAAAGTCLTHHLFLKRSKHVRAFARMQFGLEKSPLHNRKHSESLRHTCVHCGSFAPAAPRRTRTLVSESVSGLPLSRPVQIIALPGLYPNNKLICRSPILCSARYHSRTSHLSAVSPNFSGLWRAIGYVSYVLLSCSPWQARTSMA